jgi:hypothetical protein
MYGNTATQTSTVTFDPIVRNFIQTGTIGGDGIVNADEAAAGFTIGGTIEANSTIEVELANGAIQTVTAGSNGRWSVTFTDADLPDGEGTMGYTINATDSHGNPSSLAGSFEYDLITPNSPNILFFQSETGALRGIGTLLTDSEYSITEISSSGASSALAFRQTDDVTYDESFFRFSNTVPDGSYLVVTAEDTAGNDNSTLLIVNNTDAVTVDLSRAGLESFDFGTIDLSFAPDAQLTITESQIIALTDNDNTLIIDGDAADHVTALGAVDTGQTVQINDSVHHVYTLGTDGATLLIEDTITNVTI